MDGFYFNFIYRMKGHLWPKTVPYERMTSLGDHSSGRKDEEDSNEDLSYGIIRSFLVNI